MGDQLTSEKHLGCQSFKVMDPCPIAIVEETHAAVNT